MAFAAVDSTNEPRSFSIGTRKCQIMTWSAISGDTTGTITADRLQYLEAVYLDGGLIFNTATTFAGNVATLAFNDPGASVYGTLLCVGR